MKNLLHFFDFASFCGNLIFGNQLQRTGLFIKFNNIYKVTETSGIIQLQITTSIINTHGKIRNGGIPKKYRNSY